MINLRPWFDSNVGPCNVNRFMFHAGSQVCQESRPMDASDEQRAQSVRVLLMHKLDRTLLQIMLGM
jgi:hypothetical protein